MAYWDGTPQRPVRWGQGGRVSDGSLQHVEEAYVPAQEGDQQIRPSQLNQERLGDKRSNDLTVEKYCIHVRVAPECRQPATVGSSFRPSKWADCRLNVRRRQGETLTNGKPGQTSRQRVTTQLEDDDGGNQPPNRNCNKVVLRVDHGLEESHSMIRCLGHGTVGGDYPRSRVERNINKGSSFKSWLFPLPSKLHSPPDKVDRAQTGHVIRLAVYHHR
ncbi:hypothetical protein CONLIGDRAFT_648956 [Coniochaeta ligniaria NRRL 30616]|uniref:Uncharacterized protein n=1 Tax=Coniochaeta ligniaria NRRL 30616 TaxID=1408157 RepID=A0A1J7IA23_9PEZI|nr:hypothetical protein CONLIGDRAFT_648956 [Coniochaeta ligniaria NRRL 30616]